ncbi:MAG TPA: sulfite exporter TauE/SafE family protein [Ferruginibacter sp.]|nr:sulfite exporter TauE/SafE family protein [Ferruginibacter sp.]HMP21204.1 sulfite exporter TauE/SafE family protein [Ferruginibacter sp.]
MAAVMIAACIMGVTGSFHCVGMCGPLALALPLQGVGLSKQFAGTLLYNTGRITAYSLFGLLAGAVGEGFTAFGFQRWVSLLAGVFILTLLVIPKWFPAWNRHLHSSPVFFQQLREVFGKLFFKKNQASFFAIGFLNGLLPCGMVYLAFAGAAATGSFTTAILFMVFFGLGTLPAMWAVAFWGQIIGWELRKKLKYIQPYVLLLMALLLIVRGMALGLPYISPKPAQGSAAVECHTVKSVHP